MKDQNIELPSLPEWADTTLQGEDRASLFAWAEAAIDAALQSQDQEDVKEVIERLPRYNFGYVSDEWGMGQHLGAIRHDNGRFLRIDEVMVAIDHARRVEESKDE